MVGSCALAQPCTHYIPEDDHESEDIMGLIQGSVYTWADSSQRSSSAQPPALRFCQLLVLRWLLVCVPRAPAPA